MRRWLFHSYLTLPVLCHSSRHQTSTFRKTREVQKVGVTSDMSEYDEPQEDTSLFDLTKSPAVELPRTLLRSSPTHSYLSETERHRLARLIHNAHYKSESTDAHDPAMMYQSALEVQWLEEWAHTTGTREGRSPDETRRAIKRAVLERADLHKPLAYVIGSQPFYGCDVRVTAPLLCPRPETEMWTHWFVRHHLSRATAEAPLRILDVCCGTGCVGVAIARHVPNAHVTALDIDDTAVQAARENATRNGIAEKRYTAMRSDMFEVFLNQLDATPSSAAGTAPSAASSGLLAERRQRLEASHVGSFDAVVANPPYVLPEQYENLPPGIKLWESRLALVGDAQRAERQYLYFQELCELGAALLKPKAQRDSALALAPNFVVEVGLQGERVASLMERSGLWESVELHMGYAQQLRWISASSTH